ncbi:MAG: hypothetical protein ACP5LE_06280, partial [Thermoplasmata archaeon]
MEKRGEESFSREHLRRILKSVMKNKIFIASLLAYIVIAYFLSPYFLGPPNWSKPTTVDLKTSGRYFWMSQVLPGESGDFFIISYSKPHMFEEQPHPGTLALFKMSNSGDIITTTIIDERTSSGNGNIQYFVA